VHASHLCSAITTIYRDPPTTTSGLLTGFRLFSAFLAFVSCVSFKLLQLNATFLFTMTKSGKREPNLWREAYKALYTDEEEKDHMQKLQAKLRQRLNNPTLNLKTEDGYKKLLKFISKEGAMLEAKKRPERFHKVLQNILEIKGLVEAGAAVGGPYVAIPAAALFLVFSVCTVIKAVIYFIPTAL
jgi:HD-GYP domain-containing protein (c-di-GMP phosphodiesterase class II)